MKMQSAHGFAQFSEHPDWAPQENHCWYCVLSTSEKKNLKLNIGVNLTGSGKQLSQHD